MDLFNALPTWVVFVIAALLIYLSLELGYRAAEWRKALGPKTQTSSTNMAAGAILGLVTFLLAFTFGIAASHHEERKSLVLEEANIIGTAYLRMDLLPEEPRLEALGLLETYLEVRIDAANNDYTRDEFFAIMGQSTTLQNDMWRIVVDASVANPSPLSTPVINAMNDLIDIHTVRIERAVGNRIPISIWTALLAISTLGIASAAYGFSEGASRRSEVMIGLVFAFAAVITLIADLDNPLSGFLQGNQGPLEDVLAAVTEQLSQG